MSTSAARHPSARTSPGLFAYASFAIMVGGWVAFALALLASQQTLEDIWASVRELPLLAEIPGHEHMLGDNRGENYSFSSRAYSASRAVCRC